jgi:hypothetical protein
MLGTDLEVSASASALSDLFHLRKIAGIAWIRSPSAFLQYESGVLHLPAASGWIRGNVKIIVDTILELQEVGRSNEDLALRNWNA